MTTLSISHPILRRSLAYQCAGRAVVAHSLSGQSRQLSLATSPVYYKSELGTYNLIQITLGGVIAQKNNISLDEQLVPFMLYDLYSVKDLVSSISSNIDTKNIILSNAHNNVNDILSKYSKTLLTIAGLISEYDSLTVDEFNKMIG